MCRTLGSIPTDSESTELKGYVFIKTFWKILKQVVHKIHLRNTAAGVQFNGGEAIWTSKHGTCLGCRRPHDQRFPTIRGVTLRKSKSTLVLGFLTHEMCVGLILEFPH